MYTRQSLGLKFKPASQSNQKLSTDILVFFDNSKRKGFLLRIKLKTPRD